MNPGVVNIEEGVSEKTMIRKRAVKEEKMKAMTRTEIKKERKIERYKRPAFDRLQL